MRYPPSIDPQGADTVLVQVLSHGDWTDYARTSPERAATLLPGMGGEFRAVDWVYKERVLDLSLTPVAPADQGGAGR